MFGTFKDTNVGGRELPERIQAEPIVGYRTWRVIDYEGLALHSLHINYVWAVENEAVCNPLPPMKVGNHPERISPDLACACGFYCALPDHPIDEWDHMVRGRVRATGTVALYGRVVRCEKGYKGQYALIQSPVVVEVNCSGVDGNPDLVSAGTCEEPVTQIGLPMGNVRDLYGYCRLHAEVEWEEPPVFVEAGLWMREAIRQLSARYQPVEFYSWLEL